MINIIDQPVAVRAHEAQTARARTLHQRRLSLSRLGGTLLAKARREHGGKRHTAGNAIVYCIRHRMRWQYDANMVWHLGCIGQSRMASNAHHLVALGVDRVDVALKAEVYQLLHAAPAKLRQVVGSAEKGYPARRKKAGEVRKMYQWRLSAVKLRHDLDN